MLGRRQPARSIETGRVSPHGDFVAYMHGIDLDKRLYARPTLGGLIPAAR